MRNLLEHLDINTAAVMKLFIFNIDNVQIITTYNCNYCSVVAANGSINNLSDRTDFVVVMNL